MNNAEIITKEVAEATLRNAVNRLSTQLPNHLGFDRCMTAYNVARTLDNLKETFGKKGVKSYVNEDTCEVTFVLTKYQAEETVICIPEVLLDCPFCGAEAKEKNISAYGADGYYIVCKECGCRTDKSNKARAMIAWNRRCKKGREFRLI